ncbi:MAG: FAD-dependent oxidoreductase [Candidatus Caenarcaniphilales bacterium]|nr:FAD-dependent oxidoreductase [Candidatus Caenarcaniphilales bacterium]
MDAAIIGGGLAGLSIALELARKGKKFILFEKRDQLGGKLKTLDYDAFKLDVGFQVLLSAYPHLQKLLSHKAFSDFSPCYFDAGTKIFKDGNFYTLSDPLQEKQDAIATFLCPLVSFNDKLQTLFLNRELSQYSFNEILHNKDWQEITAREFIEKRGFSGDFISNFARPFFGGVFGEDSLLVRASNFAFCYKAFAEGKVFLPSCGIGELAQNIQKVLPSESIFLNSKVTNLESNDQNVKVFLDDGKFYSFKNVVLATEMETTAELFQESVEEIERVSYSNLYFSGQESLYEGKKIFINGNDEKIINNGVQLTNISTCYRPKLSKEHLISITVLDQKGKFQSSELLSESCLKELESFFPKAKGKIKFIKQFDISGRQSLIKQTLKNFDRIKSFVQRLNNKLPSNIFLAGEYLTEACSQESTLQSAEEVINKLCHTS